MRIWMIDVEDSDGCDSTQEVRADNERLARRRAIGAHFESAGYYDWQSDESACPAIVRVTVL